MRFDTIIRSGTIVTASDTFAADIGIIGDKVSALAPHRECRRSD
jgi:dihydropyrimidinase